MNFVTINFVIENFVTCHFVTFEFVRRAQHRAKATLRRRIDSKRAILGCGHLCCAASNVQVLNLLLKETRGRQRH